MMMMAPRRRRRHLCSPSNQSQSLIHELWYSAHPLEGSMQRMGAPIVRDPMELWMLAVLTIDADGIYCTYC
jgi:hypothetical protein